MLRRMRTPLCMFRRRSWTSLGSSARSTTAHLAPSAWGLASPWLLVLWVASQLVACQPAEPVTQAAVTDEATAAQQLVGADIDPVDDAADPAEAAPEELQSVDTAAAPPSGCWTERSCGARKYVCKRPDSPRPCGAPGCSEMQFACSSDAGCLEGYRCVLCKPGDPFPCSFATGLCRPATCTSDRDCGSPNLVCQSGACAHKTCRSSRSCRGYCVAGSCWNKAGWCHDTTLPPPP